MTWPRLFDLCGGVTWHQRRGSCVIGMLTVVVMVGLLTVVMMVGLLTVMVMVGGDAAQALRPSVGGPARAEAEGQQGRDGQRKSSAN